MRDENVVDVLGRDPDLAQHLARRMPPAHAVRIRQHLAVRLVIVADVHHRELALALDHDVAVRQLARALIVHPVDQAAQRILGHRRVFHHPQRVRRFHVGTLCRTQHARSYETFSNPGSASAARSSSVYPARKGIRMVDPAATLLQSLADQFRGLRQMIVMPPRAFRGSCSPQSIFRLSKKLASCAEHRMIRCRFFRSRSR